MCHTTGADPGFFKRGGAKDCGAHQDHEARSPLRLRSNALEALGVYALSCYLSLSLKHSDTKRDTKNIVDTF